MNLQGNFLDYLLVFGGGVLISFSPCVYPLLPVSIGYIGSRSPDSKIKGFILSLVYVSGIAITYSALGLIAALTGKLFGRIATHPVSNLVVGIVFIIFGFSLLELFNLKLPQVSVKKSGKKGFIAVFIVGLISGLAVGPCVAPALGAILVYIASKENVLYGASLLFVFAFGMGFLLILAGTFSGFLLSLPKPGKWLTLMEKIAGIILIIAGVYFILKAGRIIL
ncbi:MAG: cytochrome c biogenesis protein CcdA [Candidatus Omnitrophica bacterium]|nr:cytochrome c biogenesis protein CcdA [Candidatus Omnitrophota bacterium]HOX54117.1 cytochrome c biogenesis protein CcdA [Candidatus Omnitrophota bacterium]